MLPSRSHLLELFEYLLSAVNSVLTSLAFLHRVIVRIPVTTADSISYSNHLEHEPTIGQTPFGMNLREMFFEIGGFKMTTRDGAGLGFGS